MLKLLECVTKFPCTQIFNDSCACSELEYAISNGAVGATTNPFIVFNVLKSELKEWEPTIKQIINENPHFSEDDVAWALIQAIGSKASKLLMPHFIESNGKKGRISFQTNAKFYNNADKTLKHALLLAKTVPNVQIKAPTSLDGIKAFEEMTYHGISINATVSFTVAQAISVAEAVERGLERRCKEGLPIDQMNPVCTIMAGRVDDYLKDYIKKNKMLVEPEILEYAGIEVTKHAYEIYKKRGYRTTLLVAAFRNQYNFTDFIGGDIILTIPYEWQVKYNNANLVIENNIEKHVDEKTLNKLLELKEFRKAYLEDGLKPEEFEHYGAFIATMNQFLNGYDDLIKLIRSYMMK